MNETVIFRLDGVGECVLPVELTPADVVWARTGDDGVKLAGTNAISASAGFSVTTSLAIPGIVRMQAYLAGPDKKKFTYTDRSGKSASNVELTEVFPLNFKPYSKQQHLEAKT